MAKPDWAGPLAPIPENMKDLKRAVWTTGIVTGIYTLAWFYHVWNTIPRMAAHHYWNPSRRAILSQAVRQTPFPSVARSVTGLRLWTPVSIIMLGLQVRDWVGEKDSYQSDYDRIDRARTMAMGGTGTHVIGGFTHHPYHESPSGDRVWYSFHPEWI